jgi:DNA-3-methyladenine glycosylase II
MTAKITLRINDPYDFLLSLRAMASFSPEPMEEASRLRAVVRIDGEPAVLEIRQKTKNPLFLKVSCSSARRTEKLREVAEGVLFAGLDLGPFYGLAEKHKKLGPIVKQLWGLKPIRTVSLFEMAVIAITEQQISLAAAYRIRSRVIECFGERIDSLWAFPTAGVLARASLQELQACGLSVRKSEYISDFSRKVADGSFDLNALKGMADDEVRATITRLRGFGPWSANYILVRGLGRTDCVPADDLGVRTVVGKYLGDGSRMTPAQVEKTLKPFVPYRGLAAFYLLVYNRLEGTPGDQKIKRKLKV